MSFKNLTLIAKLKFKQDFDDYGWQLWYRYVCTKVWIKLHRTKLSVYFSATAKWTRDHDEAAKLIGIFDHEALREKIKTIRGSLNASHTFQNGDFSLLFHAVVRGNEEAFKILLAAGAAPDWRNRAGNTAFSLLAKRNLVAWAEHCVTLNKDMTEPRIRHFVNMGSHIGWTVLMQASANHWNDVAEWMLGQGADPNQQMPATGWSAMHSAAKVGNKAVLKMLLEKGGKKDLRASHSQMGINLAVEDCTSDQAILDLLNQY